MANIYSFVVLFYSTFMKQLATTKSCVGGHDAILEMLKTVSYFYKRYVITTFGETNISIAFPLIAL